VNRTDAPRVTVIIATYNWSTVLPYSIGSVLDQTFTDFEVLVVGDHCTDDSAEVVAAIEDERVRWHNLEVGFGHQWGPNNEGIRLARGSVIAYLGHDDLWLPHHLEKLLGAIDAGAHMAYARTLYVPPDEPARIIPSRWARYHPGSWVVPTALAHERTVALDVGGWRNPRATGSIDPEADLCARIAAQNGFPTVLRSMTSVKLPAERRRDVYRLRPHHEQAEWLARIRAAAEPERALRNLARREPLGDALGALRARLRIRSRLGLAMPAAPTAEERRRERRVYKGLDA